MKAIATIAIACLLASCADMPMTIGIEGQHGTYSYSAKRGIEISVHATK